MRSRRLDPGAFRAACTILGIVNIDRVASCARLLLAVTTLALSAACASHARGLVPPGTAEPDKFLFDKGTDALNAKKWLTAREFFKQVTEIFQFIQIIIPRYIDKHDRKFREVNFNYGRWRKQISWQIILCFIHCVFYFLLCNGNFYIGIEFHDHV